MKLTANIGEQAHDVEINVNDGQVTASVDGREYCLTVSKPEAGSLLIKHGDTVFDALVATTATGDVRVRIGSDDLDITLIDPKRLRGRAGDDDVAGGVSEVRTAMHGKIVRLLVEIGMQVEKGQGMVVVEAMKMQNELKSPRSGVVREIRSEAGQTVAAGEILIVIE